jgi:transcriptional regulator with XRE-family HTH domain
MRLLVDFTTIISPSMSIVNMFLTFNQHFCIDICNELGIIKCKEGIMTIGERIKEVRKSNGLTQQKFADRLNLKRNTIANYEINIIEPSDRTISDVCRIFGANEAWLRTGEGDMFVKRDPEQEIMAFVAEITGNADGNDFRLRFFRALSKIPPEMWGQIEAFIDELSKH